MPYQKRFLKEFSRRPEDAGQAKKFSTAGQVNAMDVLQFQGSNLIGGILNETLRLVPEYSGENPVFGNTVSVPARNIAGTRYETLVRTEIPRGGFFRDFNEPVGNRKASREKREFEMFPFMGFWEADEQLLKVAPDGGAALMQDDAQAVLSGLVMDLGEYFYYGKTNTESQKAFPGLIQQMPGNRTTSANGTGSSLTSIYFAWLDPSLLYSDQWKYAGCWHDKKHQIWLWWAVDHDTGEAAAF
ncbi:hypothetical protein FACS189454_09570 [Planctomycetales bacterium]|nr:hypothetical protein FACS189454_09570 [Planctomycetales bacterium]